MRVGVMSDTHLRTHDDPSFLKRIIEKHFFDCSIILHAGDLVHLDHFYHIIPEQAQFMAVTGNMDGPMVADHLPARRILDIENHRIGLVHGHGSPHQIQQTVLKQFAGEKMDAIVFGHSHKPFNQVVNEILLFNPGSPTDKRFAPYPSVGKLDINGGIQGRIIRLEG